MLKDYKEPEDIIGENGLLKQLTRRLLGRAMAAEMTEHVGYEKHDTVWNKSGVSRNGNSAKTLTRSFGTMEIEVPRDEVKTWQNGSWMRFTRSYLDAIQFKVRDSGAREK